MTNLHNRDTKYLVWFEDPSSGYTEEQAREYYAEDFIDAARQHASHEYTEEDGSLWMSDVNSFIYHVKRVNYEQIIELSLILKPRFNYISSEEV